MWKILPELNNVRNCCACNLLNQNIIYCFGGDIGAYLNTFESLDISNEGNTWKNVILNKNEQEFFDGSCSFQINDSAIIIFKGNSKNTVFEFDVNSMQIKKNNTISATCDCFRETCYKIGDIVYFIGEYNYLHQYNLKTRSYSSSKGI